MSQDPPSFSFPPPAPPAAPPPPPPFGGAGDAGGPRLPWEERDRLGFLNALIDTVKLIVTAPGDAFSRLRPDGDLIWPLIFGLVFSWIGQFFSQIWSLIFGSAMQSLTSGFGDLEGIATFGATSIVQVIVMLVLWPVFFAIIVFLSSGLYHLFLMLVGGVEESPLGFEGTLKVVAYSQVVQLANVVPILGFLIVLVAMVILLVVGFTAVHKTTQGKALIAVLIPLTLCCICVFVGILFFGAALAAAMSGAG